jgi:GR25 family glycosyltransferase involved in LPS biosynthesis
MRCLYINLALATDRRQQIEESFRLAPAGWSLERIEASTPDDVVGVSGHVSPTAKACYLSHRRALEYALKTPGDVMILEDDAAFSSRSFAVIDQLCATTGDWDVLLTDVALLESSDIINACVAWGAMSPSGRFRIGPLRGVSFAGATAYIVRESAKPRLLGSLAQTTVETPYDFRLRDLFNAGALSGAYVFPFVTTVSPHADASQISLGAQSLREASYNAFRRVMFMDRDLAAGLQAAEALLDRVQDDHARACGAAITALLASR